MVILYSQFQGNWYDLKTQLPTHPGLILLAPPTSTAWRFFFAGVAFPPSRFPLGRRAQALAAAGALPPAPPPPDPTSGCWRAQRRGVRNAVPPDVVHAAAAPLPPILAPARGGWSRPSLPSWAIRFGIAAPPGTRPPLPFVALLIRSPDPLPSHAVERRLAAPLIPRPFPWVRLLVGWFLVSTSLTSAPPSLPPSSSRSRSVWPPRPPLHCLSALGVAAAAASAVVCPSWRRRPPSLAPGRRHCRCRRRHRRRRRSATPPSLPSPPPWLP